MNAKILLIDDLSFKITNSEFKTNARFAFAFQTEKRRLIESVLQTSLAVLQIGITPFHQRKIKAFIGAVYLLDKNTNSLHLEYQHTLNLDIPESSRNIPVGKSVSGWAAKDGCVKLIPFKRDWVHHYGDLLPINSAYSIPLISDGFTYGVLTIGVRCVSQTLRSIDTYPLRLLAKKITFILMHDHAHCMLYAHGWRDNHIVKEQLFYLANSPTYKCVSLIGTFNGWNEQINIMHKDSGGDEWVCSLGLPRGNYFYRYLVTLSDGSKQQIPDPTRPEKFHDVFGLPCSILTV
ncbi:MAG: hypothetical protein ACE14V_14670 [bacterium]